MIAAALVVAGLMAAGLFYHRHRQVVARNEANLRYAYTLTSFTLGELRDEVRTTVSEEKSNLQPVVVALPDATDVEMPLLPLDADGELDLRYYHAQLADLRSASSEGNANFLTALSAIQTALDLYSQLAHEAPDDPNRLLNATRARLSFARLMDRTGRPEAAGIEAEKTMRMLTRMKALPGCDPTLVPPLHCDALSLAAKAAYEAEDFTGAVRLTREMLKVAESLPSSLLVRPQNEVAPRLALAASDLATYAIAAGPAVMMEARREIEHATTTCRAAHERDPVSPALTRGLAHCLHAQARLSLHAGPGEDVRSLIEEGAKLLIGNASRVRLSSLPLIQDYFATATAWTGAILENPDTDAELAKSAAHLAYRFVACLRSNGRGTGEVMLLRVRLFLHESRLACRFRGREKGARPAARAVRLLRSLELDQTDRLDLALLNAVALHQLRELAEFPDAEWNEEDHGAHLERLLKQISDRSDELTPEQHEEFSALH
jgi:hypothetical protein